MNAITSSLELPLSIELLGRGTATKSILDLLGLSEREYHIIMTIADRERTAKNVALLREEFGFTEFAGEGVEFHASGAITFPILGKSAKIEDKLAFDPDRAKRRPMYPRVKELFPEYTVFIGGSSSFDMVPAPNDKFYALSKLCAEEGYSHDEVLYVGDDYLEGGNDHSVAVSDIAFVTIDDYTKLGERLAFLL